MPAWLPAGALVVLVALAGAAAHAGQTAAPTAALPSSPAAKPTGQAPTAVAALNTPTTNSGQALPPPLPLFGTRELYSANLTPFPKWRGTLERFQGELKNCPADSCGAKRWEDVVAELRGKDLMTQLNTINREMNAKRYIIDPVNWNMPDYWATPLQFMRKNGDCEDYAIAKYMALKELGVPVDEMRIVVLQDLNLRIAHAVLAVYVKGTPYILDNQISTVVPASSIHHYQPVYSINENGWWLHRG
jgi:predicted transglutaminase-like cysteine proteinase